MKRKIMMVLMAASMLLTACSSGAANTETEDALNNNGAEINVAEDESGQTASSARLLLPASEKPDSSTLSDLELSGKLTLSLCWDYYYMEDSIKRFQDLHPNVEIEIDHYHSDYEKYVSNVDAQLMSKTAADIIDGGGLDFLKYSNSGALADFVPLMNQDPRFYPEDYYQNALEAMAYQGSIYSFPINFDYDMIAINNVIGESGVKDFTSRRVISMVDLMDLYEQYGPENNLYLYYNLDAAIVASAALNDFVDADTKTSNINSPEFIKMITAANAGTEPDKYIGGTFGTNFYGKDFDERNAETCLYRMTSPDNMEYFMPFEKEAGNDYYSDMIPVGYKNGKIKVGTSKNFFISENSENKELAWEFIKFLTTLEGAEGVWHPAMPVKRDVAEKHLREQMEMIVDGIYEEMYPGRFALTEEIAQNAINAVNTINEQPMEAILAIEDSGIYDEMTYLFNGTKTAEQVAETIHNKISLFLME